MNNKNLFKNNKIIIGIDTSFDDTSCAIIKNNVILSNIIYNQINEHKNFKGIVPDIASKSHLKCIYNIFKLAINKSNIKINNIDGIAFTKGPGLISSLIIGENFAKSISLILNIPLFSVNHIHAHILSFFLVYKKKKKKYPKFPYICLSVSGGHTLLCIVNNFFNIKILGKTLDENLGNFFNKMSVFFGFNHYNGYKILEKYSFKGVFKYKFPIPKVKNFNFSFSGLKTYIENFFKKKSKKYIKKNLNNIFRSLHETIYNILIIKFKDVINYTNIKNIAITGGVSNNKFLIKKLKYFFKKKNINFFYLKNKKIINDNGAMIALIGQLKYYFKKTDNFNIKSNSNLKLNNNYL
ncbi:MAG: tRNA (adenosine(37)-N6)-threonylcarbamoyltransferase complex transferase subunit TsaD [Candidatus Shikimatogenerans sp. JK-2022]|nr:tRNA (adenosine(37)-N6)-threonylcarbamoyltransferase complex transferase subunit TsaD [Candidatus Shikimatogenerans bostrichidophilus]